MSEYEKGLTFLPQAVNSLVPVWAEINLERLRNNLTVIYNHLKPGTRIMAVVKANAYGHGAVKIAAELEKLGVTYYAVATVDEGVEIRLAGIKGTILILEMIGLEQLDLIFQYNLTPSVYSLELAQLLVKKANETKRKIKIHLRIDTGIGGLGIERQELKRLVGELNQAKHLELEGIYTHLTSDYREDDASVREQMNLFRQILKELEDAGVKIPLVHVASSLAVFTKPEIHFNLVRTGIALYGIPPVEGMERTGLRPVMRLKSRVLCLKKLKANDYIGTYHEKYTAAETMNYAIVPIGYADAFFLITTQKGTVLIRGKRAPIIGRARMNQILVDVTMIPETVLGDEVVVLGEQGKQEISAQTATVAAGITAVNCESVCLLSSRIPRIYYHENDIDYDGFDPVNNEPIIAGAVND